MQTFDISPVRAYAAATFGSTSATISIMIWFSWKSFGV